MPCMLSILCVLGCHMYITRFALTRLLEILSEPLRLEPSGTVCITGQLTKQCQHRACHVQGTLVSQPCGKARLRQPSLVMQQSQCGQGWA